MLIRFILRALPLFGVAAFTLAVYLAHTPAERARELAQLESRHLVWPVGLAQCPDHAENLPLAACLPRDAPRNPLPPH
ncbi:hypothetical protein [Paracoccus sp. TOH]|uniref:Uncharacterized protein n=1 Tax=Paracoccus simplex TaxID=2086346 RepID=A0ABV7S357_9RHOB|nr:hypothetical protein [Paracoccus sp. TOH]WJS83213.1 hypothetical protein NBE95_05315 [Paracoccus sp. TOH]